MDKVFSIYDAKAQAYLQPFFMSNIGLALRAIGDCLSDPNHQFTKHPEDYTLFNLGTFDPVTGIFESDKVSLGNLVEFIPQPNLAAPLKGNV